MKAIKRPDGALLPYCKIHEAMDALEAEHLDLELDAAEADLVTRAVNEPGPVDEHREACYVPVRGDQYKPGPAGTMGCHVSRRSLPVLMRRIQDLGGQRGGELVGRICLMLGVGEGR
ncbi:MAG: hypothetical protein GF320_14175 [Armatimonadia bacterium]|nr:hypothetical protein [Armatimonadia bacterium]